MNGPSPEDRETDEAYQRLLGEFSQLTDLSVSLESPEPEDEPAPAPEPEPVQASRGSKARKPAVSSVPWRAPMELPPITPLPQDRTVSLPKMEGPDHPLPLPSAGTPPPWGAPTALRDFAPPPVIPTPPAPAPAVVAPPADASQGGMLVTLPRESYRPGPAIEPELPLKRVLIVDDDSDYRDALRVLLLRAGYEVFAAEDGERGMELAEEVQPHLVITDFNMPRMNGYELLVAMRDAPDLAAIPTIVFTGAANKRQLAGLDLGHCTFLEKPFPNEVLLRALHDFIGSGHAPAPEGEGPARRRKKASTLVPEPVEISEPAEPAAPEPVIAPEVTASVEMVETKEDSETTTLDNELSDSPLIAQINRILAAAVQQGASDVHFEVEPQKVVVRFRVDGALRVIGSIPGALRARLAARIKIMSKLIITERRMPQDGQIRASIDGRKVEFRVSTVPGQFGENVVLRILGGAAVKSQLSELGMSERDLECLQRASQAGSGLILVTGPTGSGKSTTLYTLLNKLNAPDVKILTAEDPVEHEITGITQVQAKPLIGLSFEKILRAFMRQDPDVILIGEIRDLETAEIAIKASITGHLVLSTLHTNSASATVVRLAQMGVPPYLVASSVRLVVAQRLVRTLCAKCKAPAAPDPADLKVLLPAEAGRLGTIYAAPGCADCRGTGFKGRMPIFEVMPVTPELRQRIQAGEKADGLAAQAARDGMRTLREAALDAVAAGRTSLAETMEFLVAD